MVYSRYSFASSSALAVIRKFRDDCLVELLTAI